MTNKELYEELEEFKQKMEAWPYGNQSTKQWNRASIS